MTRRFSPTAGEISPDVLLVVLLGSLHRFPSPTPSLKDRLIGLHDPEKMCLKTCCWFFPIRVFGSIIVSLSRDIAVNETPSLRDWIIRMHCIFFFFFFFFLFLKRFVLWSFFFFFFFFLFFIVLTLSLSKHLHCWSVEVCHFVPHAFKAKNRQDLQSVSLYYSETHELCLQEQEFRH